jgi:hypothetical protein
VFRLFSPLTLIAIVPSKSPLLDEVAVVAGELLFTVSVFLLHDKANSKLDNNTDNSVPFMNGLI